MIADGFVAPDFTAPLDTAAMIAACPNEAQTKGMFFNGVIDLVRTKSKELAQRRYTGFRDYPVREFMQVCVDAGRALAPDASPREQLRRIGQLGYPTLAESVVGRVLFAAAGRSPQKIYKLAAQGYSVSIKPTKVEVVGVREASAHIRLERVYNFLDCYHVGVFEGVLVVCNKRGTVHIKRDGTTDGEFLCTWTE